MLEIGACVCRVAKCQIATNKISGTPKKCVNCRKFYKLLKILSKSAKSFEATLVYK